MGRSGLLATLAHQARVAARERERAQRAAVRDHNAAVRRAEHAQKAAERAQTKLGRAADAERKRLEREAREAHVAAMEAEVEERNLRLAEVYDEIDSLLSRTLAVDDYVDLNTLRAVVDHPPFDASGLDVPTPPPPAISDPPEPTFVSPEPPKGLTRLFGGKNRHARAMKEAEERHEAALAAWRKALGEAEEKRNASQAAHRNAEERRLSSLEGARVRYDAECKSRERQAAEHNKALDELIANLGYGTADAVQEYVAIVLSNSEYPDHFKVTHGFEFDTSSAELRLRVLIPGPDKIPDTKEYKYSKSGDEITATSLSQKVCRDRYASAVNQVALRSLHEVFEADRRGLIKTVSLEVGTKTLNPATGKKEYVPFVVVGAARETFVTFNLSAVVPAMTLERLGAAVSKNPYGLVPAATSGVRRS